MYSVSAVLLFLSCHPRDLSSSTYQCDFVSAHTLFHLSCTNLAFSIFSNSVNLMHRHPKSASVEICWTSEFVCNLVPFSIWALMMHHVQEHHVIQSPMHSYGLNLNSHPEHIFTMLVSITKWGGGCTQ